MSDREVAGQIATNIERMNVAYLKAWLQSQVGCDCDNGLRYVDEGRDGKEWPCRRCVLVDVGGIQVRWVKTLWDPGDSEHQSFGLVPAVEVADE